MSKRNVEEDFTLKHIVNRLDALLSVSVHTEQADALTLGDKARLLKRAGLDNKVIAKILGKSQSHIRNELYKKVGESNERQTGK